MKNYPKDERRNGTQSGMMYIPVRILREISKTAAFLSRRKGTRLQRICSVRFQRRAGCSGLGKAGGLRLLSGSSGGQPEYAGQGVGGQMLSYAMALARQKGAAYLRLFVVDCNLRRSVCTERAGMSRLAAFMKSRSTRIFRCGNTDLRSGFCQ